MPLLWGGEKKEKRTEQAKTPPVGHGNSDIFCFETESLALSSPALAADGTVYVGSNDKKIYALKSDSKGPAKSSWPMRGQNPNTPVARPRNSRQLPVTTFILAPFPLARHHEGS